MRTEKEQRQRLAIALGMTRKVGTQYVVGGEFAPQIPRLSAMLVHLGYRWGRVSRDEAEEMGFVGRSPGEEGESGHHWVENGELESEIVSLLNEEIEGSKTIDGPMTLAWKVHQIAWQFYNAKKIADLIG